MESLKKRMLKDVKKSWKGILTELLEKYNIISELHQNMDGKIVYPNVENIFEAFKYFDLNDMRMLFLGQDPYINYEKHDNKNVPQAQGLAFSVPKTHKIPPSLQNIFKELKNEYPNYEIPKNGNLIRWVEEEKIMLLNAALTVEKGKSNSHKNIWKDFINDLIEYISDNTKDTVFLLLGNDAKSKSKFIEEDKHIIITGVHPSPLSANRGFFNSNIFKKINEQLEEIGRDKIIF